MSIRDQNYSQIAEKTKKAFQIFSKRFLAGKIIEVLQKNRVKNQEIVSQSEIGLEVVEQSSNDMFNDKKIFYEQNESFPKNTSYGNRLNNFNRDQNIVKISDLHYGDYVTIDTQILKDQFRAYSHLDSLKLHSLKEVTPNIFNLRRSAFLIECPTIRMAEKQGQKITSKSMICLKSAFTGHYIHLTNQISKTKQFGYEIKLLGEVSKMGLFKIWQGQSEAESIKTDEQVVLSSYHNSELKISLSQQVFLGRNERCLMGSYSQVYFKLTKLEETKNITHSPFYHIRCIQIDKCVSIEQPSLEKFTNKKHVRSLSLEESLHLEKSGVDMDDSDQGKCEFYEITALRECSHLHLTQANPMDLCQIWEMEIIEQSQELLQCNFRNVITNQFLGNDKQNRESTSHRKGVGLHLKRQERGEYIILNEQNSLLGVDYDIERKSYGLRYEQNALQTEPSSNKLEGHKFELMEVDWGNSSLLHSIMEINEVLRDNYEVVARWGFTSERKDKIKYSLLELKKNSRPVANKIKQIDYCIGKLLNLFAEAENNMSTIQFVAKKVKLVELLIIYSQVIKLKVGRCGEAGSSQVYKFASHHLVPILFKIFNLLLLLTRQNKPSSQVIIEHHIIFNELLRDYPEQIGPIVEEAIKNLCILTNQITEEEDVIFSWIAHVQQISQPSLFPIQKQYMDIISEAVVDPQDIGIHPYQLKVKEQLIGNRKKKILPRFALSTDRSSPSPSLSSSSSFAQPLIIFEYESFPIDLKEKEGTNPRFLAKGFLLRQLFEKGENIGRYQGQISYIGSILKLMRNLCKDKNKKMPRVLEDHGMNIEYLECVFKSNEMSWEMVSKFLDVYCAMYLIQDPFLSFSKREVKCYSWEKIVGFNFALKTGIIFNQFTQENSLEENHKLFDATVIPLLNKFFRDLHLPPDQITPTRMESFYNMVGILYEVVNYGYLNYAQIQHYAEQILKHGEGILRRARRERRERMVEKMVKYLDMAEQIWTIIYSMNILSTIYANLKSSKLTSNHYLVQQFRKALDYDQIINQQHPNININPKRQRRSSFNLKLSERGRDRGDRGDRGEREVEVKVLEHKQLDKKMIQFAVMEVVSSRLTASSPNLYNLMSLLERVSKRGERMCLFLQDIYILNDKAAEEEYYYYSGIIPASARTEKEKASLVNVMKIKELVDKIVEENGEAEGESRRKEEKIVELKSLVLKIIENMEHYKAENYQLYKVIQAILNKLGLHTILMDIVGKFYDRDHFQLLINEIVNFYFEFIQDNEDNLKAVSSQYHLFTRKYSYPKLPLLLPLLFKASGNKEECFWVVYRNIDLKIEDQKSKEILYESIYNILQVCPPQVLDRIKGRVCYSLLTNPRFEDYIKGNVESTSFIKMVCLMGQNSQHVKERLMQSVSKTYLLEVLGGRSRNFIVKANFLKIYYFLYIQSEATIDDTQCHHLIQKVFLFELKHLPESCRTRASQKLRLLQSSSSCSLTQGQQEHPYKEEMERITEQFSLLMLEGSEAVSASEEEQYFLYLVNIKKEEEVCLLGCLKEMLGKYEVGWVQPIAAYVFRLISFMEKIFLEQEEAYQTRILNKLYEIEALLSEKYNRTARKDSTHQFEASYQKVKQFFNSFAEILMEEGITYHTLLRCAGVNRLEVREGEEKEKLVGQWQFMRFVKEVVGQANNRRRANGLVGESKQFFKAYSQKGSKISMSSFLCKLREVLVYLKEDRSFTFHTHPSNGEEEQLEFKNSQLVKKQIEEVRLAYQLHLSHFMRGKIESTVDTLLQQGEKYDFSLFLNIPASNIFQVHMKSGQYPIGNLIIAQFFTYTRYPDLIRSFHPQQWHPYFAFLRTSLLANPHDPYIMKVVDNLYNRVKDRQSILALFVELVRELAGEWEAKEEREGEGERERELVRLERSREIYQLLSQVMGNKLVGREEVNRLEAFIAERFLALLPRYLADSNSIYWGSKLVTLTDTLLTSSPHLHHLAQMLSTSPQAVRLVGELGRRCVQGGVGNSNLGSQRMNRILNNLLMLMEKMRCLSLTEEVWRMMVGLPYAEMMEAFLSNFGFIFEEKYLPNLQLSLPCLHSNTCTQEICNYKQFTHHDQFTLQLLTNLLLILHLASQIYPSNPPPQLNIQSREALLAYTQSTAGKKGREGKEGREGREGREGQLRENQQQKYLGIIKSIEMRMDERRQVFYFSQALVGQLNDEEVNREIEEELACISKENYFLSLYHLSEYMEDQYQQLRLIQRSFIANHIVTHEHALHCLSLLFLGLVCLNMVFLGVSVPGGVLGFLNSLMVVGKSVLVVWRGRSLYYQELLLRPIRYEKSIKLLKYTRFAIGVGVILCYLLQLALPHLYPVTFFLEVLALPPLQRFISKLTQVVKSMLQLFILVQVIMITYAFSIYQKEAKGGREGSLMEVLKGLLSELVLIRLTTIEVDDPSSFPHLKQIPESLPVIMLILIYVEALFLASTILAYMREAEDKIEKCGVCGHSRTHLESLGTNFDHHISKEHSVWTYIKFFIFMRGERRRHGEERKVKDLIAKEDFKFLKV